MFVIKYDRNRGDKEYYFTSMYNGDIQGVRTLSRTCCHGSLKYIRFTIKNLLSLKTKTSPNITYKIEYINDN